MTLSSSIVLCTYNGARYLPSLWQSVLVQSRLPDEILVRDDASTDRTPELLTELRVGAEIRGIKVRILRNERNVGYVANFEAALQAASGDVLFLCDQDDAWHSDKLAAHIDAFERRSGLLFLCSDARRVDAAGASLRRSLFDVLRMTPLELRKIHHGHGFEVLLRRNLATGATSALRRSLVDVALPFSNQWVHDEWLAILAAALDGFDCIETPLIDYRQHDGNQIGMMERNLRKKWNDMLDPRAAMIDALIGRGEALLDRLHGMKEVRTEYRGMAAQKLEHLRVRQAIRGAPWHRAGPIFGETSNGRYRRYSTGWRSALRDMVRRG